MRHQFNFLLSAIRAAAMDRVKYIKMPLIILSAITCFGCVSTYYGYSEQEWNNLSEEEKQSAKAEYQQVLDAKISQQHEDLINDRRQQVIDRGVGGL